MAGVPWYFDKEDQAYHVKPGFRFPVIQFPSDTNAPDPMLLASSARQVLTDGERFMESLRTFIACLEGMTGTPSGQGSAEGR
jgi:hypothetical protein